MRENSIVPLADPVRNVDELSKTLHITLLVQVSNEAHFRLFEDDIVTEFTAIRDGNVLTVSWSQLKFLRLSIVVAGWFGQASIVQSSGIDHASIEAGATSQGLAIRAGGTSSDGVIKIQCGT